MLFYTGVTTKYELANTFATDKSLQTRVKIYFKYKEYTEDIIQDILYQILTTTYEDKLINICHKNEFDTWLFSCLKNQKTNPNSFTNRFYVNNLTTEFLSQETNENEYEKQIDSEHKQYIIELIKDELRLLQKDNWYQKKVFDEYIQLKSKYEQEGKYLTFQQFGKELNIHKNSLFEVLRKVKIRIKKRINNEL